MNNRSGGVSGEVKPDMSILMQGGLGSYTPQDYIRHLQSIISLLKTNANYHIHITGKPVDDRYMIYCREDIGVFVAKTSQPPVILAANESQMIAAFWDYLMHTIGHKEYARPAKEQAMERLQEYIAEVLGG